MRQHHAPLRGAEQAATLAVERMDQTGDYAVINGAVATVTVTDDKETAKHFTVTGDVIPRYVAVEG